MTFRLGFYYIILSEVSTLLTCIYSMFFANMYGCLFTYSFGRLLALTAFLIPMLCTMYVYVLYVLCIWGGGGGGRYVNTHTTPIHSFVVWDVPERVESRAPRASESIVNTSSILQYIMYMFIASDVLLVPAGGAASSDSIMDKMWMNEYAVCYISGGAFRYMMLSFFICCHFFLTTETAPRDKW
jgi:hypothetical protein